MIAIVFIVAFAAVCAGLGLGVVACLDRDRRLKGLERIAIGFGVGALAIYFGVFAVGPFRLDIASMGLLAAAAAVLAVIGFRSTLRSGSPKAFVAGVVMEIRRDWRLAAMLLTAGAIGLSSLVQGMAPPNDYDSLLYHLSVPKLDVERGWIAPAWNRALPHVLFPALMHHLYRFALVLAGEPAVQMVHGLFGLVAAMAAASLVRRLGFDVWVAALAAILFLATRVVVWEMATAEVDVALAAYTALALVAYVAVREHRSLGLMILVGVMLGAAMSVKHHGIVVGICFGVAILLDVVLKRVLFPYAVVTGLAAFLVFTPHLIRSYLLTGNPLFPILNRLFITDTRTFFDGTNLLYGTGRGLLDVLIAPWAFSVAPMQFFDGMVLGAPYYLALVPLAWIARRQMGAALPGAIIAAAYYFIWFYGLSQQVRFLLPVLPILAVFGAIGAVAMWGAVRAYTWAAVAFILLVGTLTLNQAMFVGIYSALRLPVALGLMSPDRFHADTPTLQGAFYRTCSYIGAQLRPGERYLSLITPHSYYCPQLPATLQYFDDEERVWLRISAFPEMSLAEFVDRFEKAQFRFVIVATEYENRRSESGEATTVKYRPEDTRFGKFIMPAIQPLKPQSADRFTAVYDGREVLQQLRAILREQK